MRHLIEYIFDNIVNYHKTLTLWHGTKHLLKLNFNISLSNTILDETRVVTFKTSHNLSGSTDSRELGFSYLCMYVPNNMKPILHNHNNSRSENEKKKKLHFVIWNCKLSSSDDNEF